jgi:two-component system nitrogen regulation response regulator NtrX
VDVRIFAATSKNLEKMMAAGQFREDLYFRLNVARIHIAPLRERGEDIPLLLEHFLGCFRERYQAHASHKPIEFSNEAMLLLMQYSWPGNIRELKSLAERCCFEGKTHFAPHDILPLLHPGEKVPVSQQEFGLPIPNPSLEVGHPSEPSRELKMTFSLDEVLPLRFLKQNVEREYIEAIIKKYDGNISRAAAKLEIDRSYLHQKISSWKSKPQ